MRAMLPAILFVAWLTTSGSCNSDSTGPDASTDATGVAGKGSGGGAGSRGGSGGAAGGACGTQCQPGQTCCYDRNGNVQCLPAGAVCTG
jgi:hypothetical protein